MVSSIDEKLLLSSKELRCTTTPTIILALLFNIAYSLRHKANKCTNIYKEDNDHLRPFTSPLSPPFTQRQIKHTER